MQGNDRQIQADRIQENQYQLSEDINQTVPAAVVKWPPNLWEVMIHKYLDDAAKRSRLGALALLAGYEI
uniref:Uncharacterized protein n=1 Tax=viral metagenome TaxID=1070528 RepID=A0A6M3XN12_9ZZZZ